MSSLIIVVLAVAAFALAYRFYADYIARQAFGLDAKRPTPAQEVNDGVDYVPTRPIVLFGHHFASIAGLGPIVGPAIAVVWGWAPAILWVVLGSIFIGAVHDMVTLGMSVRHGGRTVGDIADSVIGPRGRILFMLIILFALALAMGVFMLVISDLWSYYGANVEARAYPEAVIPSLGLIPVAIVIGFLIYKLRFPFAPTIAVGVVIMFSLIGLGIYLPIFIEGKVLWIYLLLGYALAATMMPVWLLLQPRDFLSSFNLYAMLILLTAGIVVMNPGIVAPALNTEAMANPAEGLPALVPFLFITVACGAVSGFHAMVSSGTSSKQIRCETDIKVVGFGGMITEGFLAVLVILACTAGYGLAQWNGIYSGWIEGRGLGTTIGAFVNGAANIVAGFGIPLVVSQTFFAVTLVAFAMTTLDTGCRLIRFTWEEIARMMRLPAIAYSRWFASLFAVLLVGVFALLKIGGKSAGTALWQLFGTSNQLLAGISLLVATLYFFQRRRPSWFTFIPMVFMLTMTSIALVLSLNGWIAAGFEQNAPLIVTGIGIMLLLIWLVIEAIISFSGHLSRRKSEPAIAATK